MNKHTPSFDKEKLEYLSKLFVRAEQLIKLSEQTSDGVVIPSINELRYFGYHLLQAILDDHDPVQISEQLKKAESHAKRAIYDASESIVLYHLMKAEYFQKIFSESVFVIDVLPSYIQLQQELQKAKDQIDELRKNEGVYKNREMFYENCLPYMDILKDITQQFELAKPVIRKKDDDKYKSDLKSARQHQLMIGFTVLGIVLSVVIGVFVNS